MDAITQKAIVAEGWKVGSAAEFLGISDRERQLLDLRVELTVAVRRQREAAQLSQKQLGALLKTSQLRIAKIEAGSADVSMDQLVRAFTMAGGSIVIKVTKSRPTKRRGAVLGNASLVLEVATRRSRHQRAVDPQ